MFRTVTIIALAGLASAQIPQLSQSCTSALTSIVANQDANACLSPASLIPLATSNNTSVVGPITDWTRNVCSAAPCSNETLANVVSTIVNGCQAEITGGSSGVDPTTIASSVTPLVQQYYPTVRKIVCLQNNNNNCLVSTLSTIEGVTGPLTIDNILQMVMLRNVPSLPSNVTCSDCTKAAYNILRTDVPNLVSDASSDLQQTCGANFTDGNNPSGISQSAVDSSGSGSQDNGAMTLVSSGLGVSALTVVSAVFALL
ncbi:hypothetical protein D9756_005000 [Leucocoprinus leucothites]|uniref:Secreted protein n=1 Tax=Leucocoprinus leucothites TaxID=201217 RepID=A0A8H5LKZ4_9AGAR|nr:hypothetical protein D9756_005000 [Leucoagaricus leucothites]